MTNDTSSRPRIFQLSFDYSLSPLVNITVQYIFPGTTKIIEIVIPTSLNLIEDPQFNLLTMILEMIEHEIGDSE